MVRSIMLGLLVGSCLVVLVGCGDLDLRAQPQVVRALFDPDESKIPMPSDVLRGDDGRLDLPDDDMDKTTAERELYTFMNTLEGWPSTYVAEVEFALPLAVNSVTRDTIQVWEWYNGKKTRVPLIKPELSTDGKTVEIKPPEGGWTRGATIVAIVLGGAKGVMGAKGEVVDCDPAFYYVRQPSPLTRTEWFRAFPGTTLTERQDTAKDLEEVRVKLDPYFMDAEQRLSIKREQIASMWAFTINNHTEVLMDKESGEMPLPIDLLINPKTGLLDIPIRTTDSERNKAFKKELRVFDGFGTTSGLLFEFNAPMDSTTITNKTVQLYEVATGAPVPTTVELASDLVRVELTLQKPPLKEKTTYAVVIRPEVKDAKGRPIRPMLTGHFLMAKNPLVVKGVKQIDSLEDEDIEKLEAVRKKLAPLMVRLGRSAVQLAWPITTMTITAPLLKAVKAAETLKMPVDPVDIVFKTAVKAVLEFPIGILSVFKVKEVIEGNITTPDFIDPVTRAWYPDGSHKERLVPFMMTIPDGAKPDKPLPVVIFGHAIVCERRFVLAVADAFFKKAFAAVLFDFPFHGTRTACAWNGPICLPNPLSDKGEMICADPCPSGATCSDDGQCRDKTNKVTEFSKWPIIPFPQGSGSAFIEIDHIYATRHHFSQAVTDLGALSRSLRKGNWKKAIGYTLKTDEMFYIGQSLGGIIGATYVAVDPTVKRAVLNVPGANLVPMFVDSTYFGPHIDAFLKREGIKKGTEEHQRFLNVARIFTDAVDPINVARFLSTDTLPGQGGKNDREVLVQMATLDFIIPNSSTRALTRVGGVHKKDYTAEHAFLVIPVEPAYLPGLNDAAAFIAGTLKP